MRDTAEELRRLHNQFNNDPELDILTRAADEIESLRETNIKLAEHVDELETALGLKDLP